jgi:hypothetical protein
MAKYAAHFIVVDLEAAIGRDELWLVQKYLGAQKHRLRFLLLSAFPPSSFYN